MTPPKPRSREQILPEKNGEKILRNLAFKNSCQRGITNLAFQHSLQIGSLQMGHPNDPSPIASHSFLHMAAQKTILKEVSMANVGFLQPPMDNDVQARIKRQPDAAVQHIAEFLPYPWGHVGSAHVQRVPFEVHLRTEG
jgi:hypothetical protein